MGGIRAEVPGPIGKRAGKEREDNSQGRREGQISARNKEGPAQERRKGGARMRGAEEVQWTPAGRESSRGKQENRRKETVADFGGQGKGFTVGGRRG